MDPIAQEGFKTVLQVLGIIGGMAVVAGLVAWLRYRRAAPCCKSRRELERVAEELIELHDNSLSREYVQSAVLGIAERIKSKVER
jgi:hypothetical protein